MVARMQLVYEQVGLEAQCGFRPNRGTVDSLYSIQVTLQTRKTKGLESFALFIDLVKVCVDSISREALFAILRRYGLPDHFVNIIIRLHTNATIKFKTCESQPDIEVDSTIGVRQGSNEGPVLFLFFMQAIMDTLKWPSSVSKVAFMSSPSTTNQPKFNFNHPISEVIDFTFSNALFADDCAFLFESREAIVKGTECFFNHLKSFGVDMHVAHKKGDVSKTIAMYFAAKTAGIGEQDNYTCRLDPEAAKWERITLPTPDGDKFVDFKQSVKYLGFMISCDTTTDLDIDSRIAAAGKAMGALNDTVLKNRNIHKELRGRLYVSLVVNILLYGSECWATNQSQFDKVVKFHNLCVRRMCGVTMFGVRRQHVSAAELNQRLGIEGIEHYYFQRLLRWAGHVARMPMTRLPRLFLTGGSPNQDGSTSCVRSAWHTCLFRVLAKRNIDLDTWYEVAQDRAKWRKRVNEVNDSDSTAALVPAP
jgi:hypothetical protein